MPSPDDPVALTTAPTEWQAEVIAASLRERGVTARVMGGYLAGLRAEAPAGATVMVRAGDLERARALLAEVRSASIDIDWDEVDVGESEESLEARTRCTRCGHDRPGRSEDAPCAECGLWAKGTPVGEAAAVPLRRSMPLWGVLVVVLALVLVFAGVRLLM